MQSIGKEEKALLRQISKTRQLTRKINIVAFKHVRYMSFLYILAGTLNKQDTKFYFCTHTSSMKGAYFRNWPAGNYCILKYGPCPTGM